jgi:hypothetical protein
MIKLSLQGRETTTYPQHGRYSNSLAVETSLQDPCRSGCPTGEPLSAFTENNAGCKLPLNCGLLPIS